MTAISSSNRPELDVIVWGATGFTGALVANYLNQQYGCNGSLRWGLAGRSQEKLNDLVSSLGLSETSVPLFVADSHNRESLDELVSHCHVILSTVGPYALYGTELVAACISAGTDYVDLCGETPWMREVYDRYGSEAEASDARIVHCCGFDSIPSDMGVWYLQQEAIRTLNKPLDQIKLRVKAIKGAASGGTVASMLNIVAAARKDPDVARILKNPYALNPPEMRKGVRQPYVQSATWDEDAESWIAPFVMAAINTRVVQRSNALSGHLYGKGFLYDEAMLTGKGVKGRLRATSITLGLAAFAGGAAFGITRKMMEKLFLPSPGEGPSAEAQEAGFFNLLLLGSHSSGATLNARVTGDRDPGYGSTCKMISEAAIALSETSREQTPGGFWTPATAMGGGLLKRLTDHAGLTFNLLD